VTGKEDILSLPDHLQEAFEYAVKVLMELSRGRIKESDLRFGGGTALALLWNHRHSTDLDFAIDQGAFDSTFPKNDMRALNAALKDFRDKKTNHAVPITAPNVGWRNVSFRSGGVPVSLVRSRLSDRRREDILLPCHIANSSIHIVNPSFILQGKIEGRLIENQSPVDRDGYDIAYAMKYHREIFENAIKETHKGAFLEMTSSVVGVTGLGRPILHPSDPDIATDPWKYVTQNLGDFLDISTNTKCIASHSQRKEENDGTDFRM